MSANKFRTAPAQLNGVDVLKPKPVKEFLEMMGVDINKPHTVRLENDRIVIYYNKTPQ
jgi:hypothetical protein